MEIWAEKANQWMTSSFKEVKEKNYALSWAKTIPARVYYLCDTIASAAMIRLSEMMLAHAISLNFFTWGNEREYLTESGLELSKRVSRFILSFAGAFLAPSLAYYARGTDIIILVGETVYKLLPQRVTLSYPCPVKLGWNVKPGHFVTPEESD